MGAADLVPGVSGGTIAFILGIYEELLESLYCFRRGWRFLFPLLIGISFAIFSGARLIDQILSEPVWRTYLYASFFGLILASAIICKDRVRKWSTSCVFFCAIAALLAFFITGVWNRFDHRKEGFIEVPLKIPFHEKKIENYSYSSQSITDVSPNVLKAMISKEIIKSETIVYNTKTGKWNPAKEYLDLATETWFNGWFILCGAAAVTAMLLPGISGSYILMILGAYPLVISALADFTEGLGFLKFDLEAFRILLSLGIGIIGGAIIFSRFIHWGLKHFHDIIIATLIGFMVGALPSVWPFYTFEWFVDPLKPQSTLRLLAVKPMTPEIDHIFWFSVLCSIIGALLVFFLHAVGKRINAFQNK
ncbi:MAG: hypothetical protein Tsb0021_11320 [Chlamydiales bacterium]